MRSRRTVRSGYLAETVVGVTLQTPLRGEHGGEHVPWRTLIVATAPRPGSWTGIGEEADGRGVSTAHCDGAFFRIARSSWSAGDTAGEAIFLTVRSKVCCIEGTSSRSKIWSIGPGIPKIEFVSTTVIVDIWTVGTRSPRSSEEHQGRVRDVRTVDGVFVASHDPNTKIFEGN